MGDAVVVDGLVKKYGDLTAVAGISFKVREGEIFGFLGPNGAGKTTTIHVLTTLLKPTAGKAYVNGYDVVKEAAEVRRSIGVVFQDPSLDDQLTAYENMFIHGKIYGIPTSELRRRIDGLLGFVELSKFRDVQVKKFSGGMRRRLEIARSLLHKPKVLFLDEPTLGLDPQTRAHIWEYIRKLRDEEGVTVFMTTHYMEEAEALADRVAIIDHGKIIAEGTPDELKSIVGNEIIYVKFEPVNGGPPCIPIGECRNVSRNEIALKVWNASEALPKVFEEAMKLGVRIREVSYKRPTLNDVFLYLTGREIREEGPESLMKALVVRRRMR
ncbi:MAG: ATP-binding cassette domain-containing protein [Desulfurococcales archaeon]|nr:ATP-binding cassette domain-containing protein [Desulfurococcales archaeon]